MGVDFALPSAFALAFVSVFGSAFGFVVAFGSLFGIVSALLLATSSVTVSDFEPFPSSSRSSMLVSPAVGSALVCLLCSCLPAGGFALVCLLLALLFRFF